MLRWRHFGGPARRGLLCRRGSSSVEFVGLLPALLVICLISAQLIVAGYALWSASVAARAGARAEHIGSGARQATLGALPEALRDGAEVIEDAGAGDAIKARVAVPRLLPFLPEFRVGATSRLEPDGG